MPPRSIERPTIGEIRAARERIASLIARTPLLRLQVDSPAEVHLKLESLQPIGSSYHLIMCKNVLLHFQHEERVKVITGGRNTMAAFRSLLGPEKIRAVAAYTLELKKDK